MPEKPSYSIHTDVRFAPLNLIDIPGLVESCEQEWFNQTLTRVNDCVGRRGIIRGEGHWHKHDEEDEFFLVAEGKLLIDIDDRTIELGPRQGFTVPRGVEHRTRAPDRTVILMFEGAGVVPTGDGEWRQ